MLLQLRGSPRVACVAKQFPTRTLGGVTFFVKDDLRDAFFMGVAVVVDCLFTFSQSCSPHTLWTMAERALLTMATHRQLIEMELLNIEEQLLIIHHQQQQQKRRRRRRWSVLFWSATKSTRPSEYASLVRPMRGMDEEIHFKYLRMSVGRFNDLIHRVQPHIRHQGTHNTPIGVAQRLAVAIRILASGGTQQAVAVSYKLGSSTVSGILSEVCKALCKTLQPDYLPCESGCLMCGPNHDRYK